MSYVITFFAACALLWLGVSIYSALTWDRPRPHVPAAPDNQPGTSDALLRACRRIANTPRKENRP